VSSWSVTTQILAFSCLNNYSDCNSKTKVNANAISYNHRSRLPRGVWRGSAAARLLGFHVRIPAGCMEVRFIQPVASRYTDWPIQAH